MDRRSFLRVVGGGVAALSGCTGPSIGTPPTATAPASGLRNGSFEDGLDGWSVGTDLPEDPNNPGQKVESTVEPTDEVAAEGRQSVAITIDGSADDGTAWVQQPVGHDGEGMVAVGVSVVWETTVTRHVDDVKLGRGS